MRTGDVHDVQERTGSRQVKPGELYCARVVPAGDTMQIFGGVEPVAIGQRDALMRLLDEQPHPVALVGFLSGRFPRWLFPDLEQHRPAHHAADNVTVVYVPAWGEPGAHAIRRASTRDVSTCCSRTALSSMMREIDRSSPDADSMTPPGRPFWLYLSCCGQGGYRSRTAAATRSATLAAPPPSLTHRCRIVFGLATIVRERVQQPDERSPASSASWP